MTDPWYTLFFTRTLTGSGEQPPHMFTLLHEGEGQRIFQKEERERQYANVYFADRNNTPTKPYQTPTVPRTTEFPGK